MNSMFVIMCIIGLFVVCFFLGSIPWGVIISRLFFKKDIRDEGSGNIGATNAMRSMGKKGGVPVFILDWLKGVLSGFLGYAVGGMIATHFGADPRTALACSMAACTLGHIFSPWLGWKGGKGITVAWGSMFFTYGIWGALIVLAMFLLLALITRRISCGSIAGAITEMSVGIYLYGLAPGLPFNWPAVIMSTAVGLVVIWAHRENIKRIINGTEPRVGDKKKKQQSEGK